MSLSVAYQLASPVLQGCHSCGQTIMNCQCIKYSKESKQTGAKITDDHFPDPLKNFVFYAHPVSAHNLNAPFTPENAKMQGITNDAETLGQPTAPSLGNSGLSSGPTGF